MSGERPLDHALRHNTRADGAIIDFHRGLDPAARERGAYGRAAGISEAEG